MNINEIIRLSYENLPLLILLFFFLNLSINPHLTKDIFDNLYELFNKIIEGIFRTFLAIIDNYFNTNPFGLIIFFILGALAGFLNVYRVMRRIEKE